MIKLHTGLWTNKEFAEWKGVKQTTIKNHKQKQLEELKEFADFHTEGRKVIIDKVKVDTYQPRRRKNINTIKERIPSTWAKNGYDTKRRVSNDIHRQLDKDDIHLSIADTTFYKNTCVATNELYGRPFGAAGELGSSISVMCKMIFDDSEDGYHLEPFTKEEEEIKSKIFLRFFGKDSEKTQLLIKDVEDGELPKEELYDKINETTELNSSKKFVAYVTELEEKLNVKVVRATKVTLKDISVF